MFDAFVYFVAGMAVDRFVLRPKVFKAVKIKLATWLKSMMDDLDEDGKKEEKKDKEDE